MRPLLNYSEDGLWLQVTEGDHLLAFHLSVQARWPSGPSLFGQKGIIRHQCAGKESAPLSIPPHVHTQDLHDRNDFLSKMELSVECLLDCELLMSMFWIF